ncbi:MAG: hypothetical protein FWE59_05605 [Oscillospiraceae bacterium]|nr:hypothetical protein [Oscillospiraceae bacterium]
MKKGSTKKKAAAMLALIALLVAIVGATYAWVDYDQHKSNEFNGRGYQYDVRLVEDFEEKDDWRVDDGPIKKEIRVSNAGSAEDGYGAVIVRLQFKEYMEIGDLTYTLTDKRYMIDDEGSFLVYATRGEAEVAWPDHNIANLTDLATDATGWFIETKAGDPDGQYGKYVVTEITVDMSAAEPVIPGSVRASDDAVNQHHSHNNKECEYPLHLWEEDMPLPTAQYVAWILGANVVALSDWNGLPGAFWVYDDEHGTGWVYWAQMLEPGDVTFNLLEAVELIKQPDGPFYYAIHTDMQTVSQEELDEWDDMPDELRAVFGVAGGVAP